jgi:glycine/serine hydroxymethyltransferase
VDNLVADVLERGADNAVTERVAKDVKALCDRFPVYAT